MPGLAPPGKLLLSWAEHTTSLHQGGGKQGSCGASQPTRAPELPWSACWRGWAEKEHSRPTVDSVAPSFPGPKMPEQEEALGTAANRSSWAQQEVLSKSVCLSRERKGSEGLE